MTKIILFDGDCNFCNQNVQFIIKRDPKAVFAFASLQSDIGKAFLEKYHLSKNVDSLVLIADNQFSIKSTAALKIAKQLSFPWNLTYPLIFIPRLIRDYIYDFVAKRRHRIFKKQATCTIPSKQTMRRFLE